MTEYRGFQGSSSCPWRIIYPGGNRRWLAIAQVRDYEHAEWDIASSATFEFEYDARDHMIELAERHDLLYQGQRLFLD